VSRCPGKDLAHRDVVDQLAELADALADAGSTWRSLLEVLPAYGAAVEPAGGRDRLTRGGFTRHNPRRGLPCDSKHPDL